MAVTDDPWRLTVLALVGVVAVALVSATITSTVETTAVTVQGDLNTSEVPEEFWSAPPGLYGEDGTAASRLCLSGGTLGLVAGGAVALLVAGAAAVYRRYDGLAAVGVLGMGVPVVVLVTAIATACGRVGFGDTLSNTGDTLGLGGAASTINQVLAAAPLWLVVLLGALVVGVAVVGVGDRSDVRALLLRLDNPELDDLDEEEEDAAAAVGRVAGRAADRIETGAAAENEVYRAWRSMTDHLDVDRPASSTPAEFAAAATDAGLSAGSVEELTDLFEAVRYGGHDPTAERERRAVAALRSIERDATRARASRRPDGTPAGPPDGDTSGGEDEW